MNASTFRFVIAALALVIAAAILFDRYSAYQERRQAVDMCVEATTSLNATIDIDDAEIICERDLPRR